MSDSGKQKPYNTYRGLGFTAMMGGIPLFLALGLMSSVIVSMFFLIIGIPVIAVLLIILAIATFLGMRLACENNNKAPQLIKMKLVGFLNMLKLGRIVKVDLGVQNENEKRKRFQRSFKNLFRP